MTRPTARKNLPLLRQVLDYIKAHPEDWRQTFWGSRSPSCGTAFCVAGLTVVIARPGARFIWETWDTTSEENQERSTVVVSGGRQLVISEYAQRLLGLNESEAKALFNPNNSLDDIEWLITTWERDKAAKGGKGR